MEPNLEFLQHVALAPYTTLGVGGPARWFATARSEADVVDGCAFARQRGLPLFVLGGGSNLLVSDGGFAGLVLHVALRGITDGATPPEEPAMRSTIVTAAAGEDWDTLVQHTVEHNLQGMECLAGIPGSVGGTPVQNVGAYGQEVAQTLVSARCFDTAANAFVDLRNADFGFGYRTSLLNTRQRGRYIVTACSFRLQEGGAPNLGYADLQRYFAADAKPTLAETAAAVRAIRRRKGMVIDAADPDTRSAGSFFRNPVVADALLAGIAQAADVAPQNVPHWPAGEGRVKVPAAWLLEHAGFVRGYAMGNAGISSKHTLALTNIGNARQADIAALRDRIRAEVQRRFGVELEQEPVDVQEAERE